MIVKILRLYSFTFDFIHVDDCVMISTKMSNKQILKTSLVEAPLLEILASSEEKWLDFITKLTAT